MKPDAPKHTDEIDFESGERILQAAEETHTGDAVVAEKALVAEAELDAEVQHKLQIVLPWFTSLLFHLGIIVLALFAVWQVAPTEQPDENIIIPLARLSETPGGSELTQTQSFDVQATQNLIKEIRSESLATSTADSLDSLNIEVEGSEMDLIGLVGGAGGVGASAELAPFGNTGATNTAGLGAKFYGTGGNARKIAYLVDASGSLIDTLPFVIKELKDSINSLSEKQQYTVIFFQDGDPIEVPPAGWKTADRSNKEKTFRFVNLEEGHIVPRGRTDPVRALRRAMQYRPELVFILSDNITGRGKFEVDRGELLGLLDRLNPQGKTKINTIQFLYPDPLNTLRDVAEAHGGVSKFITEADLGL